MSKGKIKKQIIKPDPIYNDFTPEQYITSIVKSSIQLRDVPPNAFSVQLEPPYQSIRQIDDNIPNDFNVQLEPSVQQASQKLTNAFSIVLEEL